MQKLFIVFALLTLLVFTQKAVGEFEQVEVDTMRNLIDTKTFEEIELVARKHFKEKENIELGRILAIEEQVVSGVNYKILFDS